jgi:single-stranded-DNA-specific exonuclease
LLNAVESCADLFTRFGGHAFAIGFAMPVEALPALKSRLRQYANEHLAAHQPERLLRIHAELPLDRITPVLVGFLRKLEPFGHGNPEPLFLARKARLLAAPRIMKDRHIRLELAQEPDQAPAQSSAHDPILAGSSSSMRAVGWDLASRAVELALARGSLVDLAYRIRENDHPEFGGLEIEIAGIELAGA